MPLVSVSFHQSCPKFWWYAFYRQHKPPSSPEQRIFPLISSLQQFDKSFVSHHFCYGVSDVNSFLRQYRLNSPTLLWDYSQIVPLNQIFFFPREPLDQLEISALTECKLKQFSGDLIAGAPSPFTCLPHARLFSLSPTTSKRLLHGLF